MPILDFDKDFPFTNLVTEVSPNDPMFESVERYLSVGLSAVAIFDYAVNHGLLRLAGPRTILDLPCGYGRVARFLRSRFPGAELTVCDLDRDCVDFCVDHFGAAGMYSTTNFESLSLGKSFDLIWVGSLITHLSANDTIKFIRCMERHLCDDGLLVMTSHGEFVVNAMRAGGTYGIDRSLLPNVVEDYETAGYGYADYSDNPGYGISIISRSWFEKFFAAEGCSAIGYFERAWDNHHDVLFVKKRKPDAC